MYGVHRAIAADCTGAGRRDVVAVAFLPEEAFPQRRVLSLDGVIYLEQTAPGKLVRHSLETVHCDHVTCAAGDIYGTGRVDLVTGNFTLTGSIDQAITIWKNLGPGEPKR